jgi:hypothetical protein
LGCLLALLALITPRFIMVVLWLFTNYLSRAFETFLWPLLGFFFLPTTTIAYAVAQNELDGAVKGWGLVLVILGIAIDLGLIGSGAKGRGIGKRFAR